jgi:hypothetical protein
MSATREKDRKGWSAYIRYNASENLDIYMKVLKQLGVKMDQSEMFEDYQAIYEETVKRQERQEDKRWNREKIR